jgi:hypothetical protein
MQKMQKGSIMNKIEEKNNISSKSTTTNTIPNKVTLSYISQKQIIDKADNSILEFIVVGNSDATQEDWILGYKFLAIGDSLGDTPIELQLKKTRKSKEDEGGKPGSAGKALSITVKGELVSLSVYTQDYGQAWQFSHTHTIDKTLFDAYVLVVQNNKKVSVLKKENDAPENFSLNLG